MASSSRPVGRSQRPAFLRRKLIYRLYLKQKLAAAEADIATGLTVSAEEARKQATEWQR